MLSSSSSLRNPNFIFPSTPSSHFSSSLFVPPHSLSFSNSNNNRISLRCFASRPIHVINPIVEMDGIIPISLSVIAIHYFTVFIYLFIYYLFIIVVLVLRWWNDQDYMEDDQG
jgi:hypothetical protein